MSSIRLKKNIVERKKKSLLKIGILAAVLLILCMAVYLSVDRAAPVFDFTDAASVYSVTDGAELDLSVFMEGVKAVDKVDGDLTDRIAIKSIRQNADSSIAVIYCVRDNAGNLTTEERIYNLQGAGGMISASENDVTEAAAGAETFVDDITSAEVADTVADTTDVETQFSDESLPETELVSEPEPATESEAEPQPEPEPEPVQKSETPVLILSASEAHIPVGTGFNYVSYIAEMWDDVDSQQFLSNNIWIENYELIDCNSSGVYNLIFHVLDSDGNISEGQPFTLYIEWQ